MYRTILVKSLDGVWTDWSGWTNCDVTCNGGVQTRKRECSNPAPANGGHPCTGEIDETVVCSLQTCPGKLMYHPQYTIC